MMTELRGSSVSSPNPPDHMKTAAPLVHVVADLSGYPDLEYISSIQTSKHYVVFRAISNKYGLCVVKATSKTPTQVEVEQLKREYQKLRLCDSDNIVSVYDIYDHQSSLGVALVSMECGSSLNAWAQKQPENPSLETVLDIGIQIAQGLDHLHRHARLIHGDITPNNVCYCQDTKRAMIIDLGGAHGFSEPGTAFTPAYHSPEQARGVSDHRSDLYSLGVLLFQLFTGHMPIQGRTPEQFRIAHLLEKPLLVSNVRDCHPMFEKIIDKLLQKRPDERYMTAAGLTHDLQCLREIIKTDTEGKTSFHFGTHEVPFIFPLPNELIGRSGELSTLDRLYDLCIKPEQGAFCSLHGKPGVGKSALIQTFALQHRNPFFFSFKFNQFGNAPMHAIIQIMTRLAHQTVRSDQFNDQNIQKGFLDRLRDCEVLRALVDLVPAYDKLIPSPDTIPEGLAADVQKILYPAIAHVLTETRKFCGTPVVLFFDDIQWIDPGSKGVLSFLLRNCIPVLVIVAFRDYSSQSVFTLESLLNKDGLNSMKMPSIDLSLHDLSQENVNELIQSLALSDQDKNLLSSTMYQQTEGNPFFLRFRLSTMAATKALTYHVESRLWRLNQDRMDLTTEVMAADAVEFCVSVLGTLDRDVTRVLCRLAMMPQGLTVDEYASVLEHEAGVVELSKAKSCTIAEAIQNAALVGFQKNILVRTENGFKFAHDRLQHSALQVSDARESSEIHYYLGTHSLRTASCTPEQAFQVLDHFSKSRELVTDKDLILRICGIMSSVCAFYVTAGSHEHLDGMLEFTRELLAKLDEDTRNSGSVECLEVRLLIAHHQIKFLMNDLGAAGQLFDEVRPHLHFAEEIRDAYHTRISLLINSGSHRQAIETTAEALSRLDDYSLLPGLAVPDGQPAALVGEVTEQIQNMLGRNTGWDIARAANSLAVSTDEDFNFRVELLISVIASVYLSGLFDLYLYISAMACKRILDNGATRSGGHAFSVLGFALVAIFGDSFGAEVAMFGKHLVDRFDNPVAACRAYALSGAAIIYDERYEHLSSRMLYDSYLAGRSAHDILWSNYAVYLLCIMVVFEGLALSEVRKTLEDPFVYAMNSGQQAVAQGGVRAVLHMVSILMGTKSTEGSTVFHFSIPSDEVTKSQPLVGFTHGAISLVALYFDGKLEIAWQIISEIVANDLAMSSPGLPPFYTFHFYAVVVAHGLLLKSIAADCNQEEPGHLSKNVCDQLLDQIKNSTDELRRLSGMACVFDPYKDIADACILEVIESKPLDALQKFESVVHYLHDKRPGKNYDLIAISQLLSAGISKRLKLSSVHHMYNAKAVATLEKWGALSVAKRIAKSDTTLDCGHTEPDCGSSQPHDSLVHDSHTSPDASGHVDGVPAAVWSNGHGFVSATQSTRARLGPDFASILASAGYITSFSTFDELTARLCTTLLTQATATRLVLFIRDQKSGVLEPAAECALDKMSPMESLKNMEYSIPIVKVTEQLQERVIVHSAQQESPHCFEPYVQRSGICSIASFPISYQGSLVACVYMEHAFKQGLFTHDIIETTTLLGHHVASAIVNALLLRDLRSRTAQLEQSHAVLAKALKVKDTILSNTSHELRSPLNGIIGLNEYILSSDKPLDPEVHNCLKTTLAMARQQLHLVSDILDMSKIHAGALKLNYETASLYALVKEVFDVAMFTSNNVRLINKISQTFPEVMVDPLRLKQVIMNLTSNAIKFTPEGSVTISCELLDDKKTFVLTVADTGIGIDPSHLDIIFEQFGQVEAYESREYQGTGLGLSITKQLVALHGGRIDVFSTVGVGTTFQVFLPSKPCNSFSTENGSSCSSSVFKAFASTESLKSMRDQSELTLDSARLNALCDESTSSVKPESDASVTAAVITTGTDTQPKHVPPVSIPEQRTIATELIGSDYATGKETNDGHRVDSLDDVPLRVVAADDTAINLKVLSNFLVKDGMEVTTVSNGKKLLEILSGYKWINYDVILLDWMMPVMDGITACRLVRERIQTDLLPIMFLTAKSDPADMHKGFEAGGTDYALKPFNRHEIIARTRSLGKSARRARALYHDSIPAALKLLTRDPFWKIQSAVKTMPMFVICVHSGSPKHNDQHSGIDGPTLLRLFRAQQLLSDSEWSFCEVDERSVSFLVAMTNLQQIRVLLRTALANLDWIESQLAKSASGNAHHDKPMITVGIDHRYVTAHLLADKLPMLAVVESPVADAKRLARTGMKHEEFILSESAKVVLNSRHSA